MTAEDDFRRRGFVVVPALVPGSLLAELRTDLEQVRDQVAAAPTDFETRYTYRGPEGADTWGVNHVFEPRLVRPSFARLLEETGLLDIATELLGGTELRFWGGHALWAPRRRNYQLHWHRDFGDTDVYSASGRPDHVQFNVCLLPDKCFSVIPGSHRRPLTPAERDQVGRSAAALPGAQEVRCRVGDVLFMNARTVHRGACPVGVPRLTLHLSVQPSDAPTGGHGSHRFLRTPGLLDTMPPRVRALMANAIRWDDEHPLTLAESLRRQRVGRRIKRHDAGAEEDGG
jgi:hypothetical protein